MGAENNENDRSGSLGDSNKSFLDRLARGTNGTDSASGDGASGSGGNGESAGSGGIGSAGSEGIPIGGGANPSGNSPNVGSDFGAVGSAGSGGGDGRGDGGTVDYSGRRGRHPNNCICPNCNIRRTAEAEGIDPNQAIRDAARGQARRRVVQKNVPESVDWGDIFPGMQDGKAPKVDDLFSLAYSTIFEVVKFARNEEHWSLAKEEANKLGKVSVNCLNTIPAAQKAKVEQKFSKYLPWCALIGFGIVITAPRVMISVNANKQKKSNRYPIPFPQPRASEERRENGAPIERDTSATTETGDGTPKPSFPPGHGENFPKFDFEIPSPTERKPS